MQDLFRVYERIKGVKDEAKPSTLAVPRYIQVLQNCVKHQVNEYAIKTMHFNDLIVLLMRLDIAQIKDQIAIERAKRNKKKGNQAVKSISQQDAIKFLKGG